MRMKAQEITTAALCAALAMVLSYVESLVPVSAAVPGVKMGLANIAVIFVLYRLGAKQAVFVSAVRVFWAAVLFGSFMTLAYSAAGAVLSLTAMILMKRSERFAVIGVSVAGGVLHNVGQIAVAVAVMETAQIAYYLPVLCVSGTLSGAAIGVVSAILVKRVPIRRENRKRPPL